MRSRLIAVAAALVPLSAMGQVAAAPPAAESVSPVLTQRAGDLVALFNGGGDPATLFAPEFLAQVPEPEIRSLSAQIVTQIGKAVRVASLQPASASAARVVVEFERGKAAMGLAVTPEGKIVGLRITGVEPASVAALGSLNAVAAEMAKLPGQAGFAAFDLGMGPARELADGLNPRERLAIGSTFKLAVLAQLVREIEAGKRSWGDQVTLDGKELPGGQFTHKPAGAKVSLRTLAEAMISVSDNSATDLLIAALGREKIEDVLPLIGWSSPANRPFLTTMELFKLKGVGGGALGTRYIKLGGKARRALLSGEVAATPGSAIGALFADGKPVRIAELEWFASPIELATAMDWFRRHESTPAGKEALRILAINPGPLAGMAGQFPYIGYKGGSEPGVIGKTLLLRDKTGGWHVLTGGWNNPAAPVNETVFSALMRRAAAILAGS